MEKSYLYAASVTKTKGMVTKHQMVDLNSHHWLLSY